MTFEYLLYHELLLFFYLGFMALQDYFTQGQSLGGAKQEIPEKKPPARNSWLVSNVSWARFEPTAVRQAI